jgi:hemerythrin-like domain-containing protein
VLANETEVLGRLDRGAARAVLSLFERFVDWSHQDKEERYVFPRVIARASPVEASRLVRCFEDHVKERRRLIGMWLHLDGACRGDENGLDRFCANAHRYLLLQREHMEEEEGYVLPLADALLTASDDERIVRGFEDIDLRLGAPHDVEQAVDDLCRRFRVGQPAAGPGHAHRASAPAS